MKILFVSSIFIYFKNKLNCKSVVEGSINSDVQSKFFVLWSFIEVAGWRSWLPLQILAWGDLGGVGDWHVIHNKSNMVLLQGYNF